MEVIYGRCAGLDVQRKTITACRVHTWANGHKEQGTVTFGTTTAELLRLLEWLLEWECTHVAMESTGVYWKPVYNILEGNVKMLLVNAHHVKQVPGRKTDVSDAEWLADLLRHGLLRASFVPPRCQRELRDLTRQRSNLVWEKAAVVNRLHKVPEDANIKLTSVVSHVMGVSARAMMEEMVAGQTDPSTLSELARGRLRNQRQQLEEALVGRVRDHHRFLLVTHLTRIDFLEEQIEYLSRGIAAHMEQQPPFLSADPSKHATADLTGHDGGGLSHTEAVELLDTIPGIARWLAE